MQMVPQVLPQTPQFFSSLLVFTHCVPHIVCKQEHVPLLQE
jgi:hypothetical protein